MKKKYFLFPTIVAFLTSLYPVAAQGQIKVGIPYLPAEPTPANFISGIYNFALMISGVLALGAIVYGGLRYMTAAGNPSGQNEGKEWIKGAIFGLMLLLGAYLILHFINPDITTLSLPTLTPIPTTTPSGGLADAQARALLDAAGIDASGVTLEGIRQSTIDELINLKRDCASALRGGCIVTVTSATGGAHKTATSQCTHANGFKADLRPNLSVDNFVTHLASGVTRGDGAPTYTHNGAIYADERTKPPRCGATCDWTGPHWDVAVGC